MRCAAAAEGGLYTAAPVTARPPGVPPAGRARGPPDPDATDGSPAHGPAAASDTSLAVLLGLLALALYALTLEPGVLGGDSAEAQFVPPLLGIPHFTGYPLFVLAGKLWTLLLPLGSLAWRMNLLSAVCGAAAVGLSYAALRELPLGRAAALFGAALAATVPLLWFWSTRAGVRAPHLLFVALILWLALRWLRRGEPATLAWLALAVGLSLAHHRTTLLLLPGLALLLLHGWRAGHRELPWVRALAGLALPQLLYLYLPLRSAMQPAYAFAPVGDWHQFWALVSASGLRGYVLALTPAEVPGRALELAGHLAGQLGPAGAVMGLAGLALLAARSTGAGLLLAASWLLTAGFTLIYRFDSPHLNVNFLLPAHLILALGAAVPLDRLSGSRPALALLGAGLLLWPVTHGWALVWEARQGPLDAYRETLRGDQAARLARLGLVRVEPQAIVVADWEQAAAFFYFQLVEGLRRDVELRYPVATNLGWTLEGAGERPVYLARLWPGLEGEHVLSAEGPLIRLDPDPPPAVSTAPLARYPEGLELLSWELPGARGGVLPVTLTWRGGRMERDYAASLRLLDDQGRLLAQQDHPHFVLGAYPTSAWPPGAVISDYFELPLPGHETALPGRGAARLRLGLVVYEVTPEGFRNLRTQEGEELVLLGDLAAEAWR